MVQEHEAVDQRPQRHLAAATRGDDEVRACVDGGDEFGGVRLAERERL
jgi:hypothetical protein